MVYQAKWCVELKLDGKGMWTALKLKSGRPLKLKVSQMTNTSQHKPNGQKAVSYHIIEQNV